MVDPAVASNDGPPNTPSNPESPGSTAYTRGLDADIFLKYDNGELFRGVVWPGPTVFPDWFDPATASYWTKEFLDFFSEDRVDIDGLCTSTTSSVAAMISSCLRYKGST